MKANKKKELRSTDKASLEKKALEIAGQLAKLQAARYTTPSKNLRESKMLRRDLAVIKSYIREKELEHE